MDSGCPGVHHGATLGDYLCGSDIANDLVGSPQNGPGAQSLQEGLKHGTRGTL